MRRFCDIEEFGTEYQSGCLSVDDQRAMKITQERTQRLTISYEVPIIWREGEPHFDNHLQFTEIRFKSLLQRFIRQPDFERDYRISMEKNFTQGYTSRLQDPSLVKYFLAHNGVYKDPKLRVVFNAAAPFKEKCLNDAIIGDPTM